MKGQIMTVEGNLNCCLRQVVWQLASRDEDVVFLTHFERTDAYAVIMPPWGEHERGRLKALGYNVLVETTTSNLFTSILTYLSRWLDGVDKARLLSSEEIPRDLP